MRKSFSTRHGFTLIELLLVIGIIAILASIVIIAINPTRQLGQARDTQRQSDVNTILNAVYQYAIDNDGSFPSDVTATRQEICTYNAPTCTTANLKVLSGTYLVNMPRDPQVEITAFGTNYFIVQDADGRITVDAPGAEQTATISVKK